MRKPSRGVCSDPLFTWGDLNRLCVFTTINLPHAAIHSRHASEAGEQETYKYSNKQVHFHAGLVLTADINGPYNAQAVTLCVGSWLACIANYGALLCDGIWGAVAPAQCTLLICFTEPFNGCAQPLDDRGIVTFFVSKLCSCFHSVVFTLRNIQGRNMTVTSTTQH